MGRPPKLPSHSSKVSPEQRREVFDAFAAWIDETDFPVIAKFCIENLVAKKYWINQDNLTDWREFEDLKRRATTKQEAYLVEKGMSGTQHTTMSIFLLKQPWLGYRDRFEQDITTGGKELTFTNGVPRPNEDKDKKGRK